MFRVFKILILGGAALALCGLYIGKLDGILVGLLGISLIVMSIALNFYFSVIWLGAKAIEKGIEVSGRVVKKAVDRRFQRINEAESIEELKKLAGNREN
jgi:hypothetical protein